MMEKKLEQLNEWFGKQITSCGEAHQKLLADDRTDEANFEKIKSNVYDIFHTILTVAVKTGKGDASTVKRFFQQKTEQIPANWVTAYNKAKENGNAEQMLIESIKLDTIQEIKQKFSEIWGKQNEGSGGYSTF